jgi:16S rRNA (uracil1498-N3)-methyltransferase
VNARFYTPDAGDTGDLARLPDDEAVHLTRVLRLAPGAVVGVFDGRGREFEAVVESADRTGVVVRLGALRPAAPEPRVAITCAQAVLKGEKMDDVVRDLVMLGVAAVQPIVTERTEVGLARAHRRERWERIAVASAKQCGRAVVPPILESLTLDQLLDRMAATGEVAGGLLLTEPSAAAGAVPLTELDATPPRAVTLMVGPEGGWTPGELRAAAACRHVTLGGRTLRADAVPLVAIAALFALWKEF